MRSLLTKSILALTFITLFLIGCNGTFSVEIVERPENGSTDEKRFEVSIVRATGTQTDTSSSLDEEASSLAEPPPLFTQSPTPIIRTSTPTLFATATPAPSSTSASTQTPTPSSSALPPTELPTQTATSLPTVGTPDLTGTPLPTPQVTPRADEEQPNIEIYAAEPQITGNFACFGFDLTPNGGLGMSCMSGNGEWVAYPQFDFDPYDYDQVDGLIGCSDRIIINQNPVVVEFDGSQFIQHHFVSSSPFYFYTDVACTETGEIWIVSKDGQLGQYDRGLEQWIRHPKPTFSDPETVLAKDMVIDRNNHIWVITNTEIAYFDGANWTLFDETIFNGLIGDDISYFFTHVTLDNDDHPVVLGWDDMFRFDGTAWRQLELERRFQFGPSSLVRIQDIYVDEFSRLWAVDAEEGLIDIDMESGLYTAITTQNSGISHTSGLSMTFDELGRQWVGTDWGINILNRTDWTVYNMTNSPILDNQVASVALRRLGPRLPEPVIQGIGGLSGQLFLNDEPVSNAAIEICQVALRIPIETPCFGQPAFMSTESDEKGQFQFTDLPVGRYYLFVNQGERWIHYRDSDLRRRYLVSVDQETALGEIDLAPFLDDE